MATTQQARTERHVDLATTRILVAGGPRVGKTRLASGLALEHAIPFERIRHTDDLIKTHEWSEASAEVARWMSEPGPWLIEGVSVVRALRKWLAAHPDPRERPCDILMLSVNPREELLPGQRSMLRGLITVWNEIRDAVAVRGLEPIEF